MVQMGLLSFLAGVMGANATPHFVRGITRERYPCLFGNGPVPNFLAGWVGLVITVVLAHVAHTELSPGGALVAIASGALLMGLFHAWHGAFGRAE